MGGHTQYAWVSGIGGVRQVLNETEEKCAGEYGLHFGGMEVKWDKRRKLFLVKIRYTK